MQSAATTSEAMGRHKLLTHGHSPAAGGWTWQFPCAPSKVSTAASSQCHRRFMQRQSSRLLVCTTSTWYSNALRWTFLPAHLNFRNIQQKAAGHMLLLPVPGYLLPSGFFGLRREQCGPENSGCLLLQASCLYTHTCVWMWSTYRQNKNSAPHSSNKLFLSEEAYVQHCKCGCLLEMPAIRDSIFL